MAWIVWHSLSFRILYLLLKKNCLCRALIQDVVKVVVVVVRGHTGTVVVEEHIVKIIIRNTTSMCLLSNRRVV